jgi:hypothetical protein
LVLHEKKFAAASFFTFSPTFSSSLGHASHGSIDPRVPFFFPSGFGESAIFVQRHHRPISLLHLRRPFTATDPPQNGQPLQKVEDVSLVFFFFLSLFLLISAGGSDFFFWFLG